MFRRDVYKYLIFLYYLYLTKMNKECDISKKKKKKKKKFNFFYSILVYNQRLHNYHCDWSLFSSQKFLKIALRLSTASLSCSIIFGQIYENFIKLASKTDNPELFNFGIYFCQNYCIITLNIGAIYSKLYSQFQILLSSFWQI